MLSPFRPAWWLPGPHLQTLGGRLLREGDRLPLRTERIELPDGDFIDLQETCREVAPDAPTALILHGLEGSARANYVASLARELERAGVRTLRMNLRGCGDEINRLPTFYHAGETGDLDVVIRSVREITGGTRIAAVGVSLGGNILLKYLGERGDDAREDIAAAATISVPFDLVAGTGCLERGGMGTFYSTYFLRKLQAKAARKRDELAPFCEIDRALSARSVRDYDNHATAHLHGFRDAWHYYEDSSCLPWVEKVRVPTLVLQSLDDPLQPPDRVPREVIRENPWLVDGITFGGGHVGFVSGTPWRPVFWAETQTTRFLAHRLSDAAECHDPDADAATRFRPR